MTPYNEEDYYTCNFCEEDVIMHMVGTVDEGHLVATGTCPQCDNDIVLEVDDYYPEADPDIDWKRSLGEN